MPKINIWKAITHIGRIAQDASTLVADVMELNSDPAIQAAIQANPILAAKSAEISQKARDIEEAFA